MILSLSLSCECNSIICTSHTSIDGPPSDEIQSLYDLTKAVQTIGDWRGLCTNLKVDEGTMNTLIHSSDRPETKKDECLKAYFDTGDATWSEVVRAVGMHPIKNKRLAKKIAEDHGVDFDRIKDEL